MRYAWRRVTRVAKSIVNTARVKQEGMRPRRPALSATIRYNKIANWKRKEIFGICTTLELPYYHGTERRTDGRMSNAAT